MPGERGKEAAQVASLLGRFAAGAGPSPLAARRAMIDRCFGHNGVEEILDALQAETEDPDWARETHAALLTKSPTSLRVTLRQLMLGQGMESGRGAETRISPDAAFHGGA